MKSAFKFTLILVLILGCKHNSSQPLGNDIDSIQNKLVGEWVDKSDPKNVSLIFNRSKHAIIVIDNQAIGGENYIGEDGEKAECKYEVDDNQKPMSLDLVFYELGTNKEKGRIEGVFRFLTDNKIEFRMGFDGTIPTSFDPDDKQGTVILDKKGN